MKKVQVILSVTFLFTALLLFAFFVTNAATAPIAFLYARAPSFSTLRNVALIAGVTAALGALVAAMIIAVASALQPANLSRKALYVLPGYLLALTIIGVILNLADLGTTVPFAIGWLALSAVLTTIAIVIAAARLNLKTRILMAGLATLALTAIASLIAATAIVASVFIVATNQPSQAGFGAGNQRPPVGSSTPAAPRGQITPVGAITPAAQDPQGGQDQFGTPPGGPAGPPGAGGPGGQANVVRIFEIGGTIMGLFAVLAVVSTIAGVRASRAMSLTSNVAPPVTTSNYVRELSRGAVSVLGVTVVTLAAIQLVPVPRTNPPVQTTVQWDSPQTQQLFGRACANCHSNETTWPWYSYIAPSSWLTVMDVNQARSQWNISELNAIQSFRRAQLPNDIAQRIRNGTMPPKDYLLIHSEAQLSDVEKQQLIQGLQKTLQNR